MFGRKVFKVGVGFFIMKFQTKFMDVKVLTRVAVMVALAVVLKSFFSPLIGGLRINTYGAPLVVLSILYGPLIGGIAGYVVDLLYATILGYGISFNFFTISTIMWGVIPGLFLFKRSNLTIKRIALAVMLASLTELAFNTLGLLTLYDKGSVYAMLPWRFGVTLAVLPFMVYIIDVIYDRVVKPELKFLSEKK